MKSLLTPWGPIRYRAGPSYDKAVRTSDVPLGPRCRVKPTRAIVAGTYWLSASEEGNADSTYRSWCSVEAGHRLTALPAGDGIRSSRER